MDKLVVVNKPSDITSRDVVNKLCKIFNTKKIGHTGTLDPIASGVLVCVCGKYTKLVNDLTSLDKEYIATIKLGIKTDTLDTKGTIIEEKDVNVTLDDIKKVFNNFPKSYNQTVPKYSAVKINGKKLYEYARNNIDIKLPVRKVEINSLELLDFDGTSITFKTKVSKGTYIRSLIEDICNDLNTIGTMSNLIRTKQGNFSIEESYTLNDIENGNYKSLSIHEFLNYPTIEIPDEYLKLIINGNKIPNSFNIKDKVIFTKSNKDYAIYINEFNVLKPYIMLNE